MKSKIIKQELLLVRGLPGSGKSTIGRNLDLNEGTHKHIEADMFFLTPSGYQFDAAKLGQAHEWCRNQTEKLLGYGENVVVTNTFIRLKEMESYFEMARRLSIPVSVIEVVGNYNSIHDVSQATISKMRARWEKYTQQ